MTEKEKLKEAARAEILQGLKDGTIKIKIVITCGHCQQEFDTEAAFQAHLEYFPDYMERVHGQRPEGLVNNLGKPWSYICPLPAPGSWAAKKARRAQK